MRQIEYRFWDKELQKMLYRKPLTYDFYQDSIIPLEFTGFVDNKGNEIFDGDILSDWTETDEGKVQSNQQVFWSEKYGQWHLDLSMKQDKSFSSPLWKELKDFDYTVTGNIYEK